MKLNEAICLLNRYLCNLSVVMEYMEQVSFCHLLAWEIAYLNMSIFYFVKSQVYLLTNE
jgi:hypothetical protein